jgi:hypothetical protein
VSAPPRVKRPKDKPPTGKPRDGANLICIEDGYVKATDIAKQLGISRFKVSRFAAMAIKEGWLKKNVSDRGNTLGAGTEVADRWIGPTGC